MPFNPPGIIGGGSIISPAVQNDPFKGINDAITRARDRKLKDKALMLEAYGIWDESFKKGTTDVDFKKWYNEDFQGKDPNQSQASAGGFFGMLGETAMSSLDGIGRIAEGLFNKGQQSAVEEIEAVNNNKTQMGENFDPGTSSSDPVKVANKIQNENEGKFQKFLSEFGSNVKTNVNEFSQGTIKPFFKNVGDAFSYRDEAAEREMTVEEYKKELSAANRVTPKEGPLYKAPDDPHSYQKMLHGASSTPQDPYGHGTKVTNARELARNIDTDDARSVKEFQKATGLEPDGILGERTLTMIRGLQSGEDEPSKVYNPKYSKAPSISGIDHGGYGMDRGGKVPGNRTGDKNLAKLEDGEYVLNRNAVDGVGKGFLDWINNERYPRFQAGGFKDPNIVQGQVQQMQPPSEKLSKGPSVGDGGGGGKKEELMKMLPMLMGAPPMQQGGYIPGYSNGGYQGDYTNIPLGRQRKAIEDINRASEDWQEELRANELANEERERLNRQTGAQWAPVRGAYNTGVFLNRMLGNESEYLRKQEMVDAPLMPNFLDITQETDPETYSYYNQRFRQHSDVPVKGLAETVVNPTEGLTNEQLLAAYKKQLAGEEDQYSATSWINKWFQ